MICFPQKITLAAFQTGPGINDAKPTAPSARFSGLLVNKPSTISATDETKVPKPPAALGFLFTVSVAIPKKFLIASKGLLNMKPPTLLDILRTVAIDFETPPPSKIKEFKKFFDPSASLRLMSAIKFTFSFSCASNNLLTLTAFF